MSTPGRPDHQLLAAALRGDATAAVELTRALADLVWTACGLVTQGRADTESAFRTVMSALRADGFARLAGYDGRAPLKTYAALVVRELLVERAVRLIAADRAAGWRAFEAFFGDDIRRLVARMLPGERHRHNRDDAYQAVCEALLRDDMKRLRAYAGRGSAAGFVLQVIEHLVIDHVRTLLPRRRLPAAIARLSTLDRAVFRLIAWERLPPDPVALRPTLARFGLAPAASEVADALQRVRTAAYSALAERQSQSGEGWIDVAAADVAPLAAGAESLAVRTPEDEMIGDEAQDLLDEALAVLAAALPTLAADEELYVRLALAGHPAREIARLAGLPVDTVHRLAQQVKRRLRQRIGGEAAVKNWQLSVQ